MTAWPFIAFVVIFSVLVCMHFVFAYRAWKASRGEPSTDIDPNYVRMEDYFARSFRVKVNEWLNLPVKAALPDGTQTIMKGKERIRVSTSSDYPAQSRSNDILVVQGTFRCLGGCVFSREIYVQEDAFIGPDSQLQSIAVDGSLSIDAGCRIMRWADSAGDMEIGANTVVGARATAGRSIRLQMGAQVGSAYAPVVSTGIGNAESLGIAKVVATEKAAVPALELPGNITRDGGELDTNYLTQLSPDCLLLEGDLKPPSPLRLKTKLIVKGNCLFPAGSILEEDLKAEGQIVIGEGSVCHGNVVARGDIVFGPRSRFYGVVHSEKALRLGRGVVGGELESKVAAFAAEALLLEEDVVVHGKLSSADRVIVLADSHG